jgi:(p)ppGpp synthase/HD superfamily hydrolase
MSAPTVPLIEIASEKNRSALRLAEELHRGVTRKAAPDTPYILHPVAVSSLAAGLGANRNTVCACCLHDVHEDTDYPLEDIARDFGPRVAALVGAVSKDRTFKALPLSDHAQLICDKLDALADAPGFGSEDLVLDGFCVKGCDLLVNMGDLVHDAERQGLQTFAKIFKPHRVQPKIGHYLDLAQRIAARVEGTRYHALKEALDFRAGELHAQLDEYLSAHA